MLEILGWVLVGAILTGALLYFWEDVKEWLNNTAADIVGKLLGYNAKTAMHRAVCVADRIANKIRTRAEVYYKRNRMDTYFDKVTIEATAPIYEIDEEVVDKIKKEGKIIQKLEYRG